jgi:predicted metal-binding membrane protein
MRDRTIVGALHPAAATDRFVVLASLGAMTVLAWAYLWYAPMPMPGASGGLRTLDYASLTLAMWFVMMIGMMVPSVAPTVLLYRRTQLHWRPDGAGAYTAAFAGGYLAAWLAFSLVATGLQIALIAFGWIDDMGVAVETRMPALLLAGVGLYQLAPAKRACLEHCRSPVEFLTTHHRPGLAGAAATGLHHGLYCLGCCWALMLLLFVGGVMNLAWVAVLSAVVLAEKLLARGEWLRRTIGVAAIVAAIVVLLRGAPFSFST